MSLLNCERRERGEFEVSMSVALAIVIRAVGGRGLRPSIVSKGRARDFIRFNYSVLGRDAGRNY